MYTTRMSTRAKLKRNVSNNWRIGRETTERDIAPGGDDRAPELPRRPAGYALV